MKLKVRILNLDAGGKTIVIINSDDSRELGVHGLERIVLSKDSKKITVIVNTTDKFVKKGEIAVYNEVKELMKLRDGDVLNAVVRPELESKNYINKKINGEELKENEIRTIIDDVMERNLNDLELAAMITACYIHGLTINENISFAKAMIKTSGEVIKFPGIVVDKHSCGGIPGDKTTILVVPIVAAAGLTIPKTSSRAITDPAGTADRVEIFAPVDIPPKKIREVVKKTKGCMVWGGALKLAPADDLLIQIEKPLSLDPLIIPSVLAKKKVVGSKYVVIDIPTGPEAKVRNRQEAEKLAEKFISVGKSLGMTVECAVTKANQPLGMSIGPALEAHEALEALMNPKHADRDLIDKATSIAGIIFTLVGREAKTPMRHLKIASAIDGKKTAEKILFSGKAEKKFREIVAAQGGNPNVLPKNIGLDKAIKYSVKSQQAGVISYISNRALVRIAKLAGAPKDRLGGMLLRKKIGDRVAKGDIIYIIHAEHNEKMKQAVKASQENNGYTVLTKKGKMVVEEINKGVKRYE